MKDVDEDEEDEEEVESELDPDRKPLFCWRILSNILL